MTADVRQVDSTSPLWDDPEFVLALSTTDLSEIAYWRRTVAPAAHRLAHPTPQYDCPGCPEGGVDEDRGAEISYWRKAAAASHGGES